MAPVPEELLEAGVAHADGTARWNNSEKAIGRIVPGLIVTNCVS